MADTLKHEYKYREKHTWDNDDAHYVTLYTVRLRSASETMNYSDELNKMLGNYEVWESRVDKPKEVKKDRKYYCDHIGCYILRNANSKHINLKHEWKKLLWRKHRRRWRRALRNDENTDLLPRRPERYAWIIS